MGSTPSKTKKKNRQSSQSLSKKAKKAAPNDNTRPRPLSDSSIMPAGPSQWNNNNHNINEQRERAQLQLQQQQKMEECVDYSPMDNYDNQDLYQGQSRSKPTLSSNNSNASIRNNGKAPSQGPAKTGGLSSFSLLKRKSNTLPRRRQETEASEYSNKPFDISSPIAESKITIGTGNYSRDPSFGSLSTEQLAPPRRNDPVLPRQSLEANRLQQQTNAYVEPPKSNAGAYKAPVPSIPTSAAQVPMSSPMPPSLPPMNMDSSPSLPSFDSAAYPPPPGSTTLTSLTVSSYYQQQDPNYSLWRESMRKAAATAADGRKNTEPMPLSRSESQRSQNSQASSTFTSSGVAHKNKPVSGSTFATKLSPSPSNASSQSSGFKQRHNRNSTGNSKTNSALPEGSATMAESSRLNANQARLYLQSQQQQENNAASENASTLSLPGSRYIGDNHSFRTDDESGNHNNPSLHTDRNASEISLLGSPVSRVNTPSLAGGVHTPKRDSQFSSPRHSTASSSHHQKRISTPLSSPVALDGGVGPSTAIVDTPASPIKTLAHNSSARESMSSVGTANYRWIEDRNVDSGLHDAINRDPVLMQFPSPTTVSDAGGSQGKGTPAVSPTTAPTTATGSSPTAPGRPPAASGGEQPVLNMEQMAQQSLEQQTQQHALLKYFFKGNYHAPLNKDELGSVLDVGCGAGLWMRDMAIEFPLTEIHGVDAVVPTRKRRPRAPPSTTNSALGSPNLTPFTSKHSSVQSTTQGQGPATMTPAQTTSFGSLTEVPPAMMDSMPSNCFFHKADTTKGLPFPDNTFDFCRIRLVLWGYNLNSFPDLLSELVRVTKKGGWIEFVDMDPCIKKANETGTRINEWVKTGLIHGNLDPDLVRSLPQFLREYCDATTDAAIAKTLPKDQRRNSKYRSGSLILPKEPYGLDRLTVSKISLPFGPWGGKVGELWQQYFTTFLQELEPLIMDATLSGLVMDQYHRQFQQEMQRRFAEAAAASEAPEGATDPSSTKPKERVTSFDQRLCTHLAWSNLIDQLIKDATTSPDSLTNAANKTTPYSHANFVKEVRSYSNFYIAYAQKVDVVELKQHYVLSQLEQDILSPNLGMPSASLATFPTLGAAAAYNRAVNNLQKLEQDAAASAAMKDQNNVGDEDGYAEPADQQSDTSHMGHTSIQKVSSPNLRQHYLATMPDPEPAFSSPSSRSMPSGVLEDFPPAEKEEVKDGYDEIAAPTARNTNRYGLVSSLSHDALESFYRTTTTPTTAATANNHSNQNQAAIATLASTAGPPTSTSVAALSIRSNSRNSHRNNNVSTASSVSATGGGGPGPSSGSPRIGYGGLRHQESIKSNNGLYIPQAQSATVVVVADEDERQGQSSDQQQQDYFSHQPIKPQQYHHHYQQQQQVQQMQQTQQTQEQAVKHKNSLLSKVLTPSASGSVSSSPSVSTVSVAAATVGDDSSGAASSPTSVSKMSVHGEEDEGDQPTEEEEESEILIALHDDASDQEGIGEDTIEILNQVSHHNHDQDSHYNYDPGPAEPVIHPVKDDEVDSIDGPLEMLTPVDGDGGGDDGSEGGDDDDVVFVTMAPPSGQSPAKPPVPVEDPGPVRDASVSVAEAARVPLPLPDSGPPPAL